MRRRLALALLALLLVHSALAERRWSGVALDAKSLRPGGAGAAWNVRSLESSAAGFRYRLLRRAQPFGRRDRDRLAAAGIEVLGAVGGDMLLVRSRRGAAADASWREQPFPAAVRIAEELRTRALAPEATIEIRVVLHSDEPATRIVGLLASLGAEPRLEPATKGRGPRVRARLAGELAQTALAALAIHPEIAWIEPWRPKQLDNLVGDWVHQSFVNGSTPLFSQGLYGCGQVVGVSDTGFDFNSCYYWDDAAGSPPIAECFDPPCPAIAVDPAQRKTLVYYHLGEDGQLGASNGCAHGNHVQGSIAGNSRNTPVDCATHAYTNTDNYDGMAPGAKLVSQELGNGLEYLNSQGGAFYDLAEVAYQNGARIHTNSWGGGCCDRSTNRCTPTCVLAYDSDARDADQASYQHPDLLILFSAGNDGNCCSAPQSIGSPGIAKNTLTVGASGHGTSATQIASYSSRGYTEDGRVKPTVVGQGSGVISARADGDVSAENAGNCQICDLSGTSMSTPTIAGHAAVAREYFARGFYPTGSEDALAAAEPSSALMRALLANSGRHHNNASAQTPDHDEGYGGVLLDDALYFAGDARQLWLRDDPVGLESGESWETTLAVGASGRLRVTLAWTDAPALLGVSPTLVNDLGLEVVDPSGAVYRVSLIPEDPFLPTATTDAAAPLDARNTEEQIEFESPTAGDYVIRVRGQAVPMGPQAYAVVVTGEVPSCSTPAAPTGVQAAVAGPNRLRVSWSAAAGAAKYRVFRSDDGGASWRGIATTTATEITDGTVSGGFAYLYAVQTEDPTGGCASTRSAASGATAIGDCLIPTGFPGAETADAVDVGASCGVQVYWSTVGPSCPGHALRYNVYRSTDPAFVPSADSLLARCVDGSGYLDATSFAAGKTHYYVVRVEDGSVDQGGPCNGGLEDANLVKVRATLYADGTTTVGDFFDGAGDTAAAFTADDGSWRISADKVKSGAYAYHNAPDDEPYAPNLCASLVSPELFLEPGLAHVLSFAIDYQIEFEWDGMVVELSSNGGVSWSQVALDGGYPGTLAQTVPNNACNFPPTQQVFTGPADSATTSGWVAVQATLPSTLDGKSIRFRFRFTSDQGLELGGVYLDDITLTGVRLPAACTGPGVAPAADFELESAPACPGSPYRFRDQSAGLPTAWSWTFGDGNTSREAAPEHSYAAPGSYRVTLAAANAAGSSTTARHYVVACDDGFAPAIAVPGVASSAGAAGSFFASTLWVANLGTQPAAIRLSYAAAPGSAAADRELEASIPAGGQATFDDVVGSFGVSGASSGVVTVWAAPGSELVATARTANIADPNATFGQFIVGRQLDRESGLPFGVSRLSGLAGNAENRTNVGVANLSDAAISARLTVEVDGQTRGSAFETTIPARAMVQVNGVNDRLGAGTLDVFSVQVESDGPHAAYASRLDNATSDPIFEPNDLRPSAHQWIDGIAAAEGANGTFFRSALSLRNAGSVPTTATIRFTPRGEVAPTAEAKRTLAAGTEVFFADVLAELFQISGAAGTLELFGADLVAWARTYNDTESGTFGQFIPAFAAEDLLPTEGAWLLGLSDDARFRTNAGLVNVGAEDGLVVLEAIRGDGTIVAAREDAIRAGEAKFLFRPLSTLLGLTDASNVMLRVSPVGEAQVYVWASVVDNGSGDAMFVRAAP